MSDDHETLNDRQIDHDYINHQCRMLLDLQVFSCLDAYDMERMVKFMRQRDLPHALSYCILRKKYTATVSLQLQEPVVIIVMSKHPATAVALCGVRLAELAGL